MLTTRLPKPSGQWCYSQLKSDRLYNVKYLSAIILIPGNYRHILCGHNLQTCSSLDFLWCSNFLKQLSNVKRYPVFKEKFVWESHLIPLPVYLTISPQNLLRRRHVLATLWLVTLVKVGTWIHNFKCFCGGKFNFFKNVNWKLCLDLYKL
jgi:hypothetical protein